MPVIIQKKLKTTDRILFCHCDEFTGVAVPSFIHHLTINTNASARTIQSCVLWCWFHFQLFQKCKGENFRFSLTSSTAHWILQSYIRYPVKSTLNYP